VRYDLTSQQEQTKIAAVADYSSQIRLIEDFLVSFDRPNELFMRLSIPTISSLGYTSLPAPLSTGGGLSFYEPSRETARLLLVPGADLVGWQISRLGGCTDAHCGDARPADRGSALSHLYQNPGWGDAHLFPE
jgi:hypothetical protein